MIRGAMISGSSVGFLNMASKILMPIWNISGSLDGGTSSMKLYFQNLLQIKTFKDGSLLTCPSKSNLPPPSATYYAVTFTLLNTLKHCPVSAVYRSSVNTPIWRRNSRQPQSWGCWPNCWTWRTPAVKPRAGSWWQWPSSVRVGRAFLWLRRSLKPTAAPWTQYWDRGLRSCSTSAKTLNYEPGCCLETPAWNPWR